ncbi:unnamed protein product [Caenorhabditis brenneri]
MARLEQELPGLRQANFNLRQQANGLANELRQAVALNKKLDFQQNQFLDLQSNLQLSNAYCAFMQNEYHKELQAKDHNNYAFLGEYEKYDLTSILFDPTGEQVVPQIVNRIHNTEAFYQSQKKRGDNKTMWRLLSREKKAGLKKIIGKIWAAQTKQMQDGLIKYRRPSETSRFWRTVEGWNLREGLQTAVFV